MSSDSPKSTGPPAGWNDPPMFSYESRVEGGRSSRLSLTKRVSFPQGSSGLPAASTPSVTDPPPPVTVGLPPPFSRPLDSACSVQLRSTAPSGTDTSTSPLPLSETEVYLAMSYQQIHSNLQPYIDHIAAHNERAAGDIRKRLEVLESQWNDGALSSSVKQKVLQLSEAVRDKDAKRGLDLQRGLMVDHGVLCTRWLPAIRHLLSASDSSAITDSTATADNTTPADSTATTD